MAAFGRERTLFAGQSGNAAVVGAPANFDITQELARADSVCLATAYGHMTGWNMLKDAILQSGATVYLLVGLDHNFTEPQLLREWMAISEKHTIDSRVLHKSAGFFHPKVLIVNSESSVAAKRPFAIVGSGNLSAGGLLNNVECSLYTDRVEVVSNLRTWFTRLFEAEAAVAITSELIAQYEPLYRRGLRNQERDRRAGNRLRKRLVQTRETTIAAKLNQTITRIHEFHVVNTNMRYDKSAHLHMLKEHTACAYEDGWKEKIRNIKEGDVVFLYESFGPGIVAFGAATGHATESPSENACCMKLEDFRRIYPSIEPSEITEMNGSRVTFGQVWQRPRRRLAEMLYKEALRRCS